MTRDRDDVTTSLLKKGFRKDNSNHQYFIYWNSSGKRTIRKTMVSHGSAYKTLGDPLLSAMAKQTGITKKSFLELVDCTLDQVGYEALAFPKSL